MNGYAIKSRHAITKIIYGDASADGFGGYIVQKLGNIISRGTFTPEERSQSSTYRELAAVKYLIQSFSDLLQHQIILWHSDNVNTTKIIQVGSSKNHLQSLALDIFKLCLKYDIQIISKWIPRDENTVADAISKYYDSDDWGIDFETFAYLQNKFGNLTIDRFASSSNKKLERFDARFHCPGVENVNTFTSHWGNEFNYLCPPISLIGDTLKHAKLCKASGILIVPEWQSSYFWPLLTPNGKFFYPFVEDYAVLDPYFLSDCKKTSVFSGFTNFRTLTLLIRF